jgi:hypothetical protein
MADNEKRDEVENAEIHGSGSSPSDRETVQNGTFDNLTEGEVIALEKKCTSSSSLQTLVESNSWCLVVRKIDIHLILALFGLFIFNILDRANIASARLGGLQDDLNLTDTQYQTAVSILVRFY